MNYEEFAAPQKVKHNIENLIEKRIDDKNARDS